MGCNNCFACSHGYVFNWLLLCYKSESYNFQPPKSWPISRWFLVLESKEHTPWCYSRNTLPNWIHIKYERFENRYCTTLHPVLTMQPCKARYIHWECFQHKSAISDLSAILAGKVGPITWQSQWLDRQGDSTGLMCVLETCWLHHLYTYYKLIIMIIYQSKSPANWTGSGDFKGYSPIRGATNQ